jgi:PAS domain S-box-containing protein
MAGYGLAHLAPLHRVRLAAVGIVALVVALFVGAAVYEVFRSRIAALHEADRETTLISSLLQHHAARTFGEIALSLSTVQGYIRARGMTDLSGAEMSEFLARRVDDLPQVRFLFIAGLDQRLIVGSTGDRAGLDLSSRGYIESHFGAGAGDIVVSQPGASGLVSGLPFFSVSKRIHDAAGRWVGVVVAVIETRYFADFFASMENEGTGSFCLARSDGTMLVRIPVDGPGCGGAGIVAVSRDVAVPALQVTYALDSAMVLAPWRRHAAEVATAATVTVVTMIGLGWLLFVHVGRIVEAEQRLRDFVKSGSDWFWSTDRDHRFTELIGTPTPVARTTGRDLIGKHRDDLILMSEIPPDVARRYLDAVATHAPIRNFVFPVLGGPNGRRYFRISGTPVFDRRARFIGYRGIASEATAEVEAERARLAAEADYRSMFENLPIGLYRSSLDGRQLRCNPALVALNGYASEAQQIEGVRDIATEWYVDPGRRADFIALLGRDGRVADFQSEVFRHKSRERIWISETAVLVRDTSGQPLYYEGTVQDITARKHAELAARAHAEQLQVTFANMDQAVMFVGSDMKVAAWNRRLAELLELGPRDIYVGMPYVDWLRNLAYRGEWGPGDPEEILKQRLENGPHLHVMQTERVRPNGVAIESRGQPLPGGDAVLTYTDVTVRRRFEEELRAAKEQAEAANRSKSAFLANMSHELRTPLNAILGFAEVIRDQLFGSQASDRYVDYARDIHASGAHLLDVIGDILDMSKIEAGRYELDEQTLDLAAVVRECVAMVGPRAAEGEVALTNACPDDLPQIHGDRRALKQVVLNLLSNAVKFTEPGGQVKVTAAIASDGRLLVEVQDSGIGISGEALGHIFEPFHQGDTSLSRRFGGTGLGLSISRRLMLLHGGTLEVHSTVGVGTVATAALPTGRLVWPAPEADRSMTVSG